MIWTEGDKVCSLKRIYRQLYPMTNVPAENRWILELFSLLPREGCTTAFLRKYFSLTEKNVESLEELFHQGWLERNDLGYSMHPLIAGCVRRKRFPEEMLTPMLRELRKVVGDRSVCDEPIEGEEKEATELFVHIARYLTGPVSRDLMWDILRAASFLLPTVKEQEELAGKLEKLFCDVSHKDEDLELVYHTALVSLGTVHREEVEQLYRKVKELGKRIDGIFGDFCVAVADGCLPYGTEFPLELLEEVIGSAEGGNCIGKAYSLRTHALEQQGRSEEAFRCAKDGVSFIEQRTDVCAQCRFELYYDLGSQAVKYVRMDMAHKCLVEMNQLYPLLGSVMAKIRWLSLTARIYSEEGRIEEALKAHRETAELIEQYLGQDSNYYSTVVSMGQLMMNRKDFKGSEEAFCRAAEFFKQSEDYAFRYHMTAHSLAHLYIRWDRPKEALYWVGEAMTEAVKYGGIALGENLHVKSRIYRLMEREREEQECLLQAYPLLKESYGEEHPKVLDAKERLALLEV